MLRTTEIRDHGFWNFFQFPYNSVQIYALRSRTSLGVHYSERRGRKALNGIVNNIRSYCPNSSSKKTGDFSSEYFSLLLSARSSLSLYSNLILAGFPLHIKFGPIPLFLEYSGGELRPEILFQLPK